MSETCETAITKEAALQAVNELTGARYDRKLRDAIDQSLTAGADWKEISAAMGSAHRGNARQRYDRICERLKAAE